MSSETDRVVIVDHKFLKKQLRDAGGLDPDYRGLLTHLGVIGDSMFAGLPLQPRTRLLVYDAPPYTSPGFPGEAVAVEEAAMVAKAAERWAEIESFGGEVRKGRCFLAGSSYVRRGTDVLMAVDALSRYADADEFDFFAGGFEISPIFQALVEDGAVVRVWGTARPALPEGVGFERITAGVVAAIGRRPLTAAPRAATVFGLEA